MNDATGAGERARTGTTARSDRSADIDDSIDRATQSTPLGSCRCYYVTRRGFTLAGFFSGQVLACRDHLAVGRRWRIDYRDISSIGAMRVLLWTVAAVVTRDSGSIYLSSRDAAFFERLRDAWRQSLTPTASGSRPRGE
ncbi:MAG TPA: hypothetical protein VFS55_13050 [Dokdonella sp.]|nr:hypothetical protein [Dokdonella sp.]